MCVDKCNDGEYGYIFLWECWKCNIGKCVMCVDGNDENDCKLCIFLKVLKNGICVESCGFDMYYKSGVCVSKCGDLFYEFVGNYFCFFCLFECL